MKLPEFTLRKILESGIEYIKEDLANFSEKDTILYHLFGEEIDENEINLYDEAKKIFTRKNNDERLLKVRLFFNRSKANTPSIHITSPSETDGPNGIGVDEDYEEQILSEDGTETYPVYTRAFNTTFNLMITSDSQTETLIIFHTFKAFLISIIDTLELNGLRNVKFSSGDLNLNEELAPPHIFVKYIGITFFHEVSSKRWFSNLKINNLITKGIANERIIK